MSKVQVIYILLAICLFGSLLRCGRLFQEQYLKRDEIHYIEMANLWADDGVKTAYSFSAGIPPVMPFVMMVGVRLLGVDALLAGRVFVFTLGFFFPLSLYFITFQILKDQKLALLAALLAALQPVYARLGCLVLRDTPYICFFMFAVASAVWSIYSKRISGWFFFAIFSALGALTRKEGIELIMIMFLWMGGDIYLKQSDRMARTFKLAGIALVVLFIYSLITIPVFLYLKSNGSTWCPFPLISLYKLLLCLLT